MNAAQAIACDLFLHTFSARQDAHVLDSRQHVDQPITPALIEWGFTQGHSVSGYMAVVGEEAVTTTVGAIDLDEGSMKVEGKAIREFLWSQHIPSLLVESRRGCHLWTFHEGDGTHGSDKYQPILAAVVRRALSNAATLAGVTDKVEVFPKASGSAWGVGALRMPLMPHPKTGEKYPAYDMDGERVDMIADLINVVASMTAPYSAVHVLSGIDEMVEYPSGRDLGAYRKVQPITGDAPTITDLLATMGVEATPGHSVRCAFHQDQHASLSILADNLRAVCKSPECALHNDGRGLGSLGLRAYMKKQGASA